ncbi:hypothetical protein ABZY93_21995 [Streptomyces smyrnaeus]|uniref:hypothetical protein n=1 Tax=Streptomyces smyrnaeus TaxID=1387713 RepID=UPI0033A697F4
MTNPARNKRKGAEWECDLRDGLREVGEDIERLHLNGKDDEGDLVIRGKGDTVPYLVIEAKNAKFEPGVFVGEMETEVENFRKHRTLPVGDVDGIVIVKRRGKNWRHAFVLTTVERYFDLPDES